VTWSTSAPGRRVRRGADDGRAAAHLRRGVSRICLEYPTRARPFAGLFATPVAWIPAHCSWGKEGRACPLLRRIGEKGVCSRSGTRAPHIRTGESMVSVSGLPDGPPLSPAPEGAPEPIVSTEGADETEMPLPSDPQTFFLGGIFALCVLAALYEASSVILPVVLAFVLNLLLKPAVQVSFETRRPGVSAHPFAPGRRSARCRHPDYRSACGSHRGPVGARRDLGQAVA
jgi:hypothetical protein